MSKIQGLFDWYWVLVSIWIIGICILQLFHVSPDSVVVELLYVVGLIGGIFWFFSGNRPRPSS